MLKFITPGCLLLAVVGAFADNVKVTWQPNAEPDLAGYFIYYGTKERPQGNRIAVGRQTEYFVQDLKAGETYYLAVTAVDSGGNESIFSEQVITTIKEPPSGWSVAHIMDVDEAVKGVDQNTASSPRNNRSLALSPDERFLYLGYVFNRYLVRKIDLSVVDPARNDSAVVAQLILPPGTQPAKDIATDDRGRVYLALGDRIEVYNRDLQAPALHTISGFTACEGLATRREKGKLAVYATDRVDKTLQRFVLVEGVGETIASSRQAGLDGDGAVPIVGAGSPRGLDIGKYGSIWIADAGNGKVYRVNAAGRTVDSTAVGKAMDVAIDTTRGEVYVSQYTLRTLKVLSLSTGKIKRTLMPPAAELNIDLDGADGFGALCGIDIAFSRERVFVANEKGRSILAGTPPDSPFSNIGDQNDVKAADIDPVLMFTDNVAAKESEVEVAVAVAVAVTGYELAQNYPNPFSRLAGNPGTMINFSLPAQSQVMVSIYNETGQLVRTLVDREMTSGQHLVRWNGRHKSGRAVAAGMYFYKLVAQSTDGEVVFTATKRMTMVK